MRLDEGEQTTKTPLQSSSLDRIVATHLEQISHEKKNESANFISKDHSPSRDDYFAIVARATNDAVRDWNVKSGALSWPQGFESLFGYNASSQSDIICWQKTIHPVDGAGVTESIRGSLSGSSEHWSGKYRFRHADGSYINVL